MTLSAWKVYQRLPFVFQFIWNPFLALDLVDEQDYPDHSKILPTLSTGGIFLCAMTGHPIGAVVAIGVLAASFGLPMFKAFLDSKQFSASGVDEVKATLVHSSTTVRTVAEQLVTEHKNDPGA